MKHKNDWDEMCEIDDLPVSSAVTVLRPSKYGSLVDLPDEELADPAELEQQAIMQQWGPILALPAKGERRAFHPSVDESGKVEGAFGSVDFDRVGPEFDKARYKAERLREQREDVLLRFDIVKERLPGKARYLVVKYLEKGIIDFEDIVSEDMRALVRLLRQAMRLEEEIAELRKASHARRQRKAMAWLEA
jgi:hypothetical protein